MNVLHNEEDEDENAEPSSIQRRTFHNDYEQLNNIQSDNGEVQNVQIVCGQYFTIFARYIKFQQAKVVKLSDFWKVYSFNLQLHAAFSDNRDVLNSIDLEPNFLMKDIQS